MEYDYMLNGFGSHSHHQEMIAQAQHERLIKELKQNSPKKKGNIRTAVTMIIQSLTK